MVKFFPSDLALVGENLSAAGKMHPENLMELFSKNIIMTIYILEVRK